MDTTIQQGELLTIQQGDLLFAVGRALGSVQQKNAQHKLRTGKRNKACE